ncbi:hypothetical protein [Sphingomonas sp. PP-CE-1G-424]|uniref:hypothetical protein n=1 Tax=Sphingomonas sp. PP-CE-1G-424 TaxID=2135658 RepID=UPI0014047379|nr:hypothetical protein [Sphingomonas sp. PP-CE-1G-424]
MPDTQHIFAPELADLVGGVVVTLEFGGDCAVFPNVVPADDATYSNRWRKNRQ